MVGYYDYVLALIPLTLFGTAGVLLGVGWDPLIAVPVAAVGSVLLIGHALFVNGPVADARSPAEDGSAGAGSPGTGPVAAD
ncbi:MAG: hypothetical protein ABEH40_07640 [Haloferacaceae archaeon]